MKPTSSEWVSSAEGHYETACTLRRSRRRHLHDAICFHSEQCVEKYLRARLRQAQVRFQKTDDLPKLLDPLRSIEPRWRSIEQELRGLSDAALMVLYPGKSTRREDATKAYKVCTRLRALARSSLGLKA
ncbi:MAG: HEPN domain-containing protein [Tepidisphaeraceae bacterium]